MLGIKIQSPKYGRGLSNELTDISDQMTVKFPAPDSLHLAIKCRGLFPKRWQSFGASYRRRFRHEPQQSSGFKTHWFPHTDFFSSRTCFLLVQKQMSYSFRICQNSHGKYVQIGSLACFSQHAFVSFLDIVLGRRCTYFLIWCCWKFSHKGAGNNMDH